MIKWFFALVALLPAVRGVAQQIDPSPFRPRISKPSRLAIIPFITYIKSKKSDDDQIQKIRDLSSRLSQLAQRQLFDELVKLKFHNKLNIDILPVNHINDQLSQAGINEENISIYSNAQLTKLLDADVLISGTIHLKTSVSDVILKGIDAALYITGVSTGGFDSSDVVLFPTELNIAKKASFRAKVEDHEKVIWRYQKTIERNHREQLTHALMKKTARSFCKSGLF